MTRQDFLVGAQKVDITPPPGIELTGWGYYLNRVWETVHDRLNATALIVESSRDSSSHPVAIVAVDLMVIDEVFAERVRNIVSGSIGLPSENVLVSCSHSHNAPAAGGLLGVGVCDRAYEEWAAGQAGQAVLAAWEVRRPARLTHAVKQLPELTFNRTRPGGVTDHTLVVAHFESPDQEPIASIVNFGAHPTVSAELRPTAVSRDVPGEVCDAIEAALPGSTCLYIQGACGDTNFLREFQTNNRHGEPSSAVAEAALELHCDAIPDTTGVVCSSSQRVLLPTRRWLAEEIAHDRDEAARRIKEKDISGWRESIGRAMTNRPDDMVKRHGGDEFAAVMAMCRFNLEWTDRMLLDYEERPEFVETEVQSIRLGDLTIVANSCEFFSPFAIEVRRRAASRSVMVACYSNGRIGYLPDRHDIERRSYAGFQSPKYCNQFPFTAKSGEVMVSAMLETIEACGG